MTRASRIDLDDIKTNQKALLGLDDAKLEKVGPRTYRKRVLRYGQWFHPKAPNGVLKVDQAFAQRLAANFNQGIWPEVAVTFGHPKDEADAVKNGTGRVIGAVAEADGYYNLVSVSEDTAKAIDEGKILACSAGLIPDYEDHETCRKVGPVQDHLALTNSPYIKNLGDWMPVQMADDPAVMVLSEYRAPEEDVMDKAELIAKAKELKIDPKELATDLGLDFTQIEKDAVSKFEADLKTLAAATPAGDQPDPEKVKEEASKELVAALGEALVGAQVLTLSEGKTPELADIVGAIVGAVQAGKQATLTLAETEAESAVDKAIREGKVLPAQKEALKKVYLSDKATFDALLPAQAIVEFGEFGTQDGTDLSDPNSATGGVNVSEEIDRYAKLAETV